MMLNYIHKKTGKRYRLVCFAMNCTNGDHDGRPMVVYRDALDASKIYTRCANEFSQKFELESA